MPELLVFRLYAPMAAFGDIAVGERRPVHRHPTHSALVGLLGAALGLRRDDPLQPALAAGYAFAIRVDREGRLLADYHTTQTPPTRRGASFRTRREELAGEVNTMLSRRDYRTDSAFTIAVLALDTAAVLLARLAEALREPSFVLYAGRKSCPLGLPPDPALVKKPTLRDAFSEYDASRAKHPCHEIWTRDGEKDVHFAPAFVDPEGLVAKADVRRRSERRDSIADRRLWRFERREEWMMRISPLALANQEGSA